jgi:glutaredoxin 2
MTQPSVTNTSLCWSLLLVVIFSCQHLLCTAAAAAAGEDIFMSLVSYKLTCVMPRIMPGGWPEKTASAMQYLEDTKDVSG